MKLPMLAVDADLLRLSFPYIALPKVDGVRAYYSGKLCGVVARSGRHFTNPVVRDQVRRFLHADLEIYAGDDPCDPDLCRKTNAIVNSKVKPDGPISYFVFDAIIPELPYYRRLEIAMNEFPHALHSIVTTINSRSELDSLESEWLRLGFEGVILRSPEASYKHGRATLAENSYLRVKRWITSEMLVTGLKEGRVNTNDYISRTKRGAAKDGYLPNGMVGSIIGTDLVTGKRVTAGAGKLTHEERKFYWQNPAAIIGRMATYKEFPSGGKDLPRQPVFQYFREDL